MTDIEHATAEEIVQLSNMGELTYVDAKVFEHALLVVQKTKHYISKYSRSTDLRENKLAELLEELIKIE